MQVIKIQKHNRDFLKIKVFPVFQKGKKFYIGFVPASHVLNLYTVEPAEYDVEKYVALAKKFPDDISYYRHLIDDERKRIDEKAFERKENKKRVGEITKFLNSEEYALFPNTIIVACEIINKYITADNEINFETLGEYVNLFDEYPNFSFIEERKNGVYLYVPYKPNSILIIDGQHRIKGLENADDIVKNDYELIVSFIVGYDKSVLAELFYTINYTQKSVNKSLLYHLSGEFSYELTNIKFMHEVVKILNEVENSPFYRRVKMLGTVPYNISDDDRKKMTVSQAFLIDYLLGTIAESESAKRSMYQPIFLYYFKREKEQIEIIRFLIKYFTAIRKTSPSEWDDPKISIMSKTISVGAFVLVLYFLFVKMFFDDFKGDASKLKEVQVNDFVLKMRGLQNVDFSTEGDFGKVGSAGSLNKLKEKLIEKIDYFSTKSYADFLNEYKKNYLPRFKKWLSTVT